MRTPLRAGASDDDIAERIRRSVTAKEAGHLINSIDYVRPSRTMHSIGG
jgi:cyclic pyranopterin phosphate synthase